MKRQERYFLVITVSAIFLLTTALILLMIRPAWPATAPPQQYTCEDVHCAAAAEHYGEYACVEPSRLNQTT